MQDITWLKFKDMSDTIIYKDLQDTTFKIQDTLFKVKRIFYSKYIICKSCDFSISLDEKYRQKDILKKNNLFRD